MKVLIVEDEPLAVERLSRHLKSIDENIELVGSLASIKSSVQWLQENEHPDIILMDIELNDGQSFEIFNAVNIKSTVIFTTSYDEFALRAFKVNSIDYLLKPIKKENLKQSLDKYEALKRSFSAPATFNIEHLLKELRQNQKEYRSRFLVKQGQRLVSVEIGEIAYFFADGRLCFFRTWDKSKYVVDYNLDELEEMLDPRHFYRANRSMIIHMKSVAQIHNYFNAKLKLELTPSIEKEVIVSREKASNFKEWMGK